MAMCNTYSIRTHIKSEFVPVSCKYPLVLLVRKSGLLICDFYFSLWRSTLNIPFWFCVLTFGAWPLSVAVADRWWEKRKMPWALRCREKIEIALSKIEIAVIKIAMSKLKLPWTNWNCSEQIEIAVSKIEIAVSKLKLPWANWNCRE